MWVDSVILAKCDRKLQYKYDKMLKVYNMVENVHILCYY